MSSAEEWKYAEAMQDLLAAIEALECCSQTEETLRREYIRLRLRVAIWLIKFWVCRYWTRPPIYIYRLFYRRNPEVYLPPEDDKPEKVERERTRAERVVRQEFEDPLTTPGRPPVPIPMYKPGDPGEFRYEGHPMVIVEIPPNVRERFPLDREAAEAYIRSNFDFPDDWDVRFRSVVRYGEPTHFRDYGRAIEAHEAALSIRPTGPVIYEYGAVQDKAYPEFRTSQSKIHRGSSTSDIEFESADDYEPPEGWGVANPNFNYNWSGSSDDSDSSSDVSYDTGRRHAYGNYY